MTDKVFVLQEPDDLFCHHFFPSPEAALQWARATYTNYEFFLVAGLYGELYLSEAPDTVVNPIFVVELTNP
mgnify:FL=1